MADLDLDQYFTPDPLARKMVEWANVDGLRVLEPSAGAGALLRHMGAAKNVTAVECDQELAEALPELAGMDVATKLLIWPKDFLRYDGWGEHDLAVMNSPFSDDGRGRSRDQMHVARAVRMCPRVVALVRANFIFGKARYHDIFRWARLRRVAVLVKRPNFRGPSHRTASTSPRHDFCVVEIERAEPPYDRLEAPRKADRQDRPTIEWWLEDWS